MAACLPCCHPAAYVASPAACCIAQSSLSRPKPKWLSLRCTARQSARLNSIHLDAEDGWSSACPSPFRLSGRSSRLRRNNGNRARRLQPTTHLAKRAENAPNKWFSLIRFQREPTRPDATRAGVRSAPRGLLLAGPQLCWKLCQKARQIAETIIAQQH